jgi:Raf kinase inhibitor-like YbhB/YbcL family protein
MTNAQRRPRPQRRTAGRRALRPPARPGLVAAAGLAAALCVLGACDTGDGKTLKDTVVPTSLPPPDTAPLESVGLEGAADSGQLPSIPLEVGSSAGAVESTDPQAAAMQLIAPWNDGTPIEVAYTCDGVDTSPPLSWRDVPDGTVELALSVIDESADSGDGPFVHWLVMGLDPSTSSLVVGSVPEGANQATNSFGDVGWGGPCPPVGDAPHVYHLTLYALAQQTELGDGVPASEALPYVTQLTMATAEITGTYAR